ncbi:MAG: hypothetical protein R3B47_09865 [Bacteroidia bacterium]
MSSIKLNLINHSNLTGNESIVICQKNREAYLENNLVAWKVISNLGPGDFHPFDYEFGLSIAAADSWGNFTPQIMVEEGSCFEMVQSPSGYALQKKSEPAADPRAVEVINNLAMGSIAVNAYRGGKLLASFPVVDPLQKVFFEFQPTLFIGVASQIPEGDILNAALESMFDTSIALLGLSSADIVMTGGGAGPNAQPVVFSLQNVKYV